MIIAQLSDTHIVAPGKLFRAPVQGIAADAARTYLEFDTATYLARAVKLARIAWSVLRHDRTFDTHLEIVAI